MVRNEDDDDLRPVLNVATLVSLFSWIYLSLRYFVFSAEVVTR